MNETTITTKTKIVSGTLEDIFNSMLDEKCDEFKRKLKQEVINYYLSKCQKVLNLLDK